jgi:hypothetical protein
VNLLEMLIEQGPLGFWFQMNFSDGNGQNEKYFAKETLSKGVAVRGHR